MERKQTKTQVRPRTQAEAQSDHKSGLLEEFSMSTVIASTLASVTSFLLASQIGIAGSLIGVGVAAATTAAVSQIYKALLKRSAEKIKGSAGPVYTEPHESFERQQQADLGPHSTAALRRAKTGTPIASETMQLNLAKKRHKRLAKRATLITAMVAVAAVLIYAAIVSLATQGQGIGPALPAASQESSTSDASASGGTPTTDQTTAPSATDATGSSTSSDATSGDSGATGSSSTETNGDATTGTESGTGSSTGADAGSSTSGTDGGAGSSSTTCSGTTTDGTTSDGSSSSGSGSSSATGSTGTDSPSSQTGTTTTQS